MTLSYGVLAVIIAGSALLGLAAGYELGKGSRRLFSFNITSFDCNTGAVTGEVTGGPPHEIAAKLYAGPAASIPGAPVPSEMPFHDWWENVKIGSSTPNKFKIPSLPVPSHTGTITVAIWGATYGQPTSRDFECAVSPNWGVRTTSTYSVEKPAVPGFKPPAMPVFSVAPSRGAGEGVRS